jgi:hypothetical protein
LDKVRQRLLNSDEEPITKVVCKFRNSSCYHSNIDGEIGPVITGIYERLLGVASGWSMELNCRLVWHRTLFAIYEQPGKVIS